jgi:hypothetical protein
MVAILPTSLRIKARQKAAAEAFLGDVASRINLGIPKSRQNQEGDGGF